MIILNKIFNFVRDIIYLVAHPIKSIQKYKDERYLSNHISKMCSSPEYIAESLDPKPKSKPISQVEAGSLSSIVAGFILIATGFSVSKLFRSSIEGMNSLQTPLSSALLTLVPSLIFIGSFIIGAGFLIRGLQKIGLIK